jgi:ABC-2 type transport system permease protein
LPLIAILIGFSSVARERESGTLRIVKSLGVSGADYLAGKLAGLAVLLGVVLLPIALGAVFLALAGPGAEAVLVLGSRAVLLVVLYTLYLGVFLLLAVGISAAARSSAQALVLLLGLWVTAVLLVPRMSASLAVALAPEPESNTFFLNVENRLARFQPGNKYRTKLEEVTNALLREHGVKTVEELPLNFTGVSLQVLDEYETEGFQEEFDELWSVYDRQTALNRIGGLLSPLIPLRELSPALSGTSLADHRHFVTAVETYRRNYVKFLNDDMRDNAGPAGFDYEVGEAFWKEVPKFEYQPVDFGTKLAQNGLPVAMLLLWGAASGGFAQYAFARRFAMD